MPRFAHLKRATDLQNTQGMKDLQEKIVWITGASSGIGKELAIQMARQGARLILTARSVDKLTAVRASLAGAEHWVYPMDLLEVAEIPAFAKKVLTEVGEVDILINNAGISQRSLAKDTSIEVDRKIMELDFFAAVALTKAVLPRMLERKSGHIVAISSVAGKFGPPMRTAYAAAKHAIIGFMDSLRAEIQEDNIHVMNVTPGSVRTDISVNALEGDGQKHNEVDPLIANGMPVEECAAKIIRGIQRNTPELLIAKGKTKLAVYLRRFFPRLLFKMIAKAQAT